MNSVKKGRKARYSSDDVVFAAMTLADEYGLEEVTMAKVARQIGCTPMALYSHIENHDALLRAMADYALSELSGDFTSTDDWRDGVAQWLQTLWQASLKRRWLVEVILVNDRITLQWLKFNEQLAAVLKKAGMKDQQIAESLTLIGCIAVSAIFQAIKFPVPRSGVVEGGISAQDGDQLDTALWRNLIPHLKAQTNESFLKEIEGLILLSLESKLAN